jgi:F-type H+-transporting ATPase subunit alpha
MLLKLTTLPRTLKRPLHLPSHFSTGKRKNIDEESIDSLQHSMERRLAFSDDEISTAADAPSLEDEVVALRTRGQLVTIGGLAQARAGTVATFEGGASAFIFDLGTSEVHAAVIDTGITVTTGERVVGYHPDSVTFPVGPATRGRVLDGLGNPIDGKGPLDPNSIERKRSLVARVPGIVARGPTTDPFLTGVKKIDLLAPIARGQRVAFLGVPGTGKTTTALNALVHHAKMNPDAHSVYAAVGTRHGFQSVVRLLEREGVSFLFPDFERLLFLFLSDDTNN